MANNWGPVVFNTYIGDPARLVLLENIINFAETHDLAKNAELVGNYCKAGLEVILSYYDILGTYD